MPWARVSYLPTQEHRWLLCGGEAASRQGCRAAAKHLWELLPTGGTVFPTLTSKVLNTTAVSPGFPFPHSCSHSDHDLPFPRRRQQPHQALLSTRTPPFRHVL